MQGCLSFTPKCIFAHVVNLGTGNIKLTHLDSEEDARVLLNSATCTNLIQFSLKFSLVGRYFLKLRYILLLNRSSVSTEQQQQLLLLLHPFNGLFCRTTWESRYQKGQTNLDLSDGVLGCSGISWTICKQSAPRCRHTNTSSFNFYRPDALPDAQPTVSKH